MARKDFRKVRDRFARDEGLPFGRLLSREYVLSVLEAEGHPYRSRVFCPLVTLWAWLSQALSQDKSLNEAVSRILAQRVASGLPPCSASSASYSNARQRFPGAVMHRMAKEIGRRVHDAADESWNWRGRPVYLADGTTLTMADTAENQLAYPQAVKTRKGLGFPITRAVALISLSTGAVIDFACGKYRGKGTGEMGMLRSLMGSMTEGDVLLADRYYPAFSTLLFLKRRGIDMVSVSHFARKVDYTTGHVLGPKDHIVEWPRPPHVPEGIDRETFDSFPDTFRVREFEIDVEARDGNRERLTIVTTITDPAIPQKELSDLYWRRWNCELDIRSIKHSMHLNFVRCKTPDMVHKEIWCHLLAYNLLRGTMVESAKLSAVLPRQLSVKGAMQAVESFTPAMMAIDGNPAIYDALMATVAAHRVGNRPGRQEPRFKKSRPVWGALMTIPRSESKRRLNANRATLAGSLS